MRRSAPNTGELEARIASYELAFRMQTKAPELVDLRRVGRDAEAVRPGRSGHRAVRQTVPAGPADGGARRSVRELLHGAGGDRWDDHGAIQDGAGHCQEVDNLSQACLRT